jgi:zinc/manganese transport system substrate-binding protein
MFNLYGKIKNVAILLTAVAFFLSDFGGFAQASEKLNVVTSTTTFGALVREIGGDHVQVTHIAPPKFNVHFIHPKPSDIRKVAKAELFVFAGLDLEAWVDPLLEAAGKPSLFRGGKRNVDLSKEVPLLNPPQGQLSRSRGDLHLFGNPHYHMDPENLKTVARTLLEALQTADPANAAYYQDHADIFLIQLNKKIYEWKGLCSHCQGREVIAYHDDFIYLAHFLGLKSEEFLEPKPGIPHTPKHMEFLESYIKENDVKAIIMPSYYPKDAPDALARKTGIKVLMIGQNVGEIEGENTLFDFYEQNIRRISQALS